MTGQHKEISARVELLRVLLSEPNIYAPDMNDVFDQQMTLAKEVAEDFDHPDALYVATQAVILARGEGIRLAKVFEKRVRDLSAMLLSE